MITQYRKLEDIELIRADDWLCSSPSEHQLELINGGNLEGMSQITSDNFCFFIDTKPLFYPTYLFVRRVE